MAVLLGANIYVDGVKRNTEPVSLIGTFNLSAWYNPLDNVSVEATLVYDDATESAKSNVVQFQLASDIVTFDPLYQAVLDQATLDGVTTPILSQNLKNDALVRQLRLKDLLNNDLFYYFEQDDASLYEFCTYNWMNPAAHRLTNAGVNPVDFIPGQGFKVIGENNQHFSTNYKPSVDAIHALTEDHSIIFKGFDSSNTAKEVRIFGGRGGPETNIYRNSSGAVFLTGYGSNFNMLVQSLDIFDSHINKSHTTTEDPIAYKDNYILSGNVSGATIGLPTVAQHLFAFNVSGTFYPSKGEVGLKYFILGKGMSHQDDININVILNGGKFYNIASDGTLVFDAGDSLLSSLYYPQIQPSSKYPQLNTTKKWIVLYSTDHDTNSEAGERGKIAWGEADNINLSDFTEKGIIWQGNQAETPCLEFVENDINGEPIHLYFHTDANDAANGGSQQTHLLTTAGGAELHNCQWIDRGPILGLTTEEANNSQPHTGYAALFKQLDGTFVAVHHTQGFAGSGIDFINRFGKSTNSGSDYNWTRITSRFDNTSFMPLGRVFHISPPFYFERSGVQYALGINIGYDYLVEGRSICIVKCENNDYLPTEFLYNINSLNGGQNAKICGYYIDEDLPDVLNLFYTKTSGTVFSNPGTELYHASWDLTNLD